MIADDRRPYCDLRSAISVWKPALIREQSRLHVQITLKELVSDVLMFGFIYLFISF